MERYLIINADDFGVCHAANEAVEELFDRGIITSTTLMTPCPWAEDALQRVKKNDKIKVGLHLTTTAEYEYYRWKPLCADTTTLTDRQGYFYRTAQESLAHASREDMCREILAQYAWMTDRGVQPDHIDSHMGTVYGIFGKAHLEPVFELCGAHHLPFRLPRLPETFFGALPQHIRQQLLGVLEWADQCGIKLPQGLYTYDDDVTEQDTYEGFKESYLKMIASCPEGVSELFLHPCIETEEIKAMNKYYKKRVWEYRLMLDEEVRDFISAQKIKLISYEDYAKM